MARWRQAAHAFVAMTLLGVPWPAEGGWNYRHIEEWNTEANSMCNHTGDQSPININTAEVDTSGTGLGPLSLFYDGTQKVNAQCTTNLHTWQVDFLSEPRRSYINWQGRFFYLKQFHFHAPSENTVDGLFHDMEAHMVHKSDDGHYLVIAQFLNVRASNEFLEEFWAVFPRTTSSQGTPASISDPYRLLMPSARDSYFHWMGSLTTPPCTNGLVWILARGTAEVSQAQLNAFRQGIYGLPNNQETKGSPVLPGLAGEWNASLGDDNRPVQPLGNRTVQCYGAAVNLGPGPSLGTGPGLDVQSPGRAPWMPSLPLVLLLVFALAAVTVGLFAACRQSKKSKKSKRRGTHGAKFKRDSSDESSEEEQSRALVQLRKDSAEPCVPPPLPPPSSSGLPRVASSPSAVLGAMPQAPTAAATNAVRSGATSLPAGVPGLVAMPLLAPTPALPSVQTAPAAAYAAPTAVVRAVTGQPFPAPYAVPAAVQPPVLLLAPPGPAAPVPGLVHAPRQAGLPR